MSEPLDPWRPFPVLGGAPVAGAPQTVPWWWIQQFERRIKQNHAQSLDKLAARGGLNPGEIWCAYHDRLPCDMPKHYVGEWLMVVVPTPPPNASIAAPPSPVERPSFEEALRDLINRYSIENASDTPDYILASYVCMMLAAFAETTRQRDAHYGLSRGIPTSPRDPNAPTPDTNPGEGPPT